MFPYSHFSLISFGLCLYLTQLNFLSHSCLPCSSFLRLIFLFPSSVLCSDSFPSWRGPPFALRGIALVLWWVPLFLSPTSQLQEKSSMSYVQDYSCRLNLSPGLCFLPLCDASPPASRLLKSGIGRETDFSNKNCVSRENITRSWLLWKNTCLLDVTCSSFI